MDLNAPVRLVEEKEFGDGNEIKLQPAASSSNNNIKDVVLHRFHVAPKVNDQPQSKKISDEEIVKLADNCMKILQILRFTGGPAENPKIKLAKHNLLYRVEMGVYGIGGALEDIVASQTGLKLLVYNGDRLLNYVMNFAYLRQHENTTISRLCMSGIQLLSMGRDQRKILRIIEDCEDCLCKF